MACVNGHGCRPALSDERKGLACDASSFVPRAGQIPAGMQRDSRDIIAAHLRTLRARVARALTRSAAARGSGLGTAASLRRRGRPSLIIRANICAPMPNHAQHRSGAKDVIWHEVVITNISHQHVSRLRVWPAL